jgi:hypothetical protein
VPRGHPYVENMDIREACVVDDKRKTALFKEVNDSMNELLLQFGAEDEADFFCECPERDCARRVPLTRWEYEGIRRTGGFLVSPECTRWPRVLMRTQRYIVVKDFRPLDSVTEATTPARSESAAGQGHLPPVPPGSRAAA